MSKHTPGPWWLDDDGFIASGSGDTYETIADPHCCSDIDIDEREANAHLIAAAPDLLEALIGMIEVFGNAEHVLTLNEVIDAKQAIVKAKGQQP